MKLFERIVLGIIRKPLKTLISFLVLFVITTIMTASVIIYNSSQTIVNDINDVIEPIVMIERPNTRNDIHYNFSNFDLERDQQEEKYNELDQLYEEVMSLSEVEYSDIAIAGQLYFEEMRNVKPQRIEYTYTDFNRYYFNCYAVKNAESYYFRNEYYKIIEGRNLTQEEVDNGEYKIVIHRSVNVEKDGKLQLAQIGDKITLGTRILKERFEDTDAFLNYDYSEAATSAYNLEYLDYLVENPTIEFEIVGIYEEVVPTNLREQPKGFMPFKTYKNIVSDYNDRVKQLEKEMIVKKYDKTNLIQFNLVPLSNAYSVFKLTDADEIGSFKEKTNNIMFTGELYGTITFANDIYLKVIGPLESLNSVSSFYLILGFVVGVILLVLITLIFIRERRHEIGILLTLGETKKKIIKQLMLEMLLIGLLAIFTTSFTSKHLVNGLQENVLSRYKESVHLSENDEVMLGNMSTKEISDKYEELLETSDSLLITVVSATSMMLVCYGSMFIILKMNPKDILM